MMKQKLKGLALLLLGTSLSLSTPLMASTVTPPTTSNLSAFFSAAEVKSIQDEIIPINKSTTQDGFTLKIEDAIFGQQISFLVVSLINDTNTAWPDSVAFGIDNLSVTPNKPSISTSNTKRTYFLEIVNDSNIPILNQDLTLYAYGINKLGEYDTIWNASFQMKENLKSKCINSTLNWKQDSVQTHISNVYISSFGIELEGSHQSSSRSLMQYEPYSFPEVKIITTLGKTLTLRMYERHVRVNPATPNTQTFKLFYKLEDKEGVSHIIDFDQIKKVLILNKVVYEKSPNTTPKASVVNS